MTEDEPTKIHYCTKVPSIIVLYFYSLQIIFGEGDICTQVCNNIFNMIVIIQTEMSNLT